MNQAYDWYSQLIKPSFAPPQWIFGPVWSVLYVIIAVTFGRMIYLAIKRTIPIKILIPIALNIFTNAIFTYIQFGLKDNLSSAIDILVVLLTIIWIMISIKPYSRSLALWQIPYLAWVSFATVLQLTVTYLNWGM